MRPIKTLKETFASKVDFMAEKHFKVKWAKLYLVVNTLLSGHKKFPGKKIVRRKKLSGQKIVQTNSFCL